MSKRSGALLAALVTLTVLAQATTRGVGELLGLLAHLGAFLVTADGVRRHRPTVPRAWGAVLALLGTSLLSSAVVLGTNRSFGASHWGMIAVQLVSLAVVPFIVRTLRGAGDTPRTTWPDVFLTTCGGALVVVQVLAMLGARGHGDNPAVLVTAAADVILAVVLLRIVITRTGTAPATILVLLAAGSLLAVSTVSTTRGELLLQTPLLSALESSALLLFAAAAQHSSMRHF
ncbi:MAG: hypothetical protein ACRYF3_13045, partial [Janthinobacterium lividum]